VADEQDDQDDQGTPHAYHCSRASAQALAEGDAINREPETP
jgi:hypothetical protein